MYIIELRLIIVIQCKINDMTIYKRGWISMFFKNEETNKRTGSHDSQRIDS